MEDEAGSTANKRPMLQKSITTGDSKYGFCSYKPECLQIFNNTTFFLIVLCFVIFGKGFSGIGLTNTMLTTIENRYGLKTTQIAMFSMCQNIVAGFFASAICYLGHKHRPIAIAIGCIVTSIGFFIMSIPHYLVPAYDAGIARVTDICMMNGTNRTDGAATEQRNHGNYLFVFLVGNAFLGLGATPLYSLGLAHIDENTNRKTSSMYYGIVAVISVIGPAVGYVAGNPILNIFVDIEQPPTSLLTPSDRNWVGAWWVAFLIGGCIMLVPVIPLLGLPSSFPHTEALRMKKRKLEDTIITNKDLRYDLKSVLPAGKSLMKNAPFMLLTVSIALDLLNLNGFALFLPKFIETQFHTTAATAALTVGLLIIPGATIGTLLGAYLCKRFSWNCQQIMKFAIVCVFLSCVTTASALIGCKGREVVGTTVSYRNSTTADKMMLRNSCNEKCLCSTQYYKPVCSVEDQQTYYSACHAGCSAENFKDGGYYNCSCLPPSSWVQEGRCSPKCDLFYMFTVCIFITLFCWFVTEVPLLNISFRIVPEGQGSFAMGVQQTFTRFLGFIPAAPIFGSLIDDSCKMWHIDARSGQTTSCLEYDNSNFRYYLFMLGTLTKTGSLFFLCLSYKFYQLPAKSSNENGFPLIDRQTEKA